MSVSKTSHFWRRDITGLRAVAVLPVLLFHAFPQAMPGGFFGVDIFVSPPSLVIKHKKAAEAAFFMK